MQPSDKTSLPLGGPEIGEILTSRRLTAQFVDSVADGSAALRDVDVYCRVSHNNRK